VPSQYRESHRHVSRSRSFAFADLATILSPVRVSLCDQTRQPRLYVVRMSAHPRKSVCLEENG